MSDFYTHAKEPLNITPIQRRLLEFGGSDSILYQHSVLCQTCLPYRNPGGQAKWSRENGAVSIRLSSGEIKDWTSGEWIEAGLPYGPKPRIVLFYLNTEAIRTQSPSVIMERSLTAFCCRIFQRDPGGRTIKTVRTQLTKLAAADYRFSMVLDGVPVQVHSGVVDKLELWSPRDPAQRVLWPSIIEFSPAYFESLVNHAIPLDESAIAALSHSSMALDVYTWLAQRLHRIPNQRLIPWTALQRQFGTGYGRLRDFRVVFCATLRQVLLVYPAARLEAQPAGLLLLNSHPPVRRAIVSV